MRTTLKLLVAMGQGGGAFNPARYGTVALWLDGSDVATLFQDAAKTTPVTADGDVVGCWADKSGTGRDATQSTTANKPLYKVAVKNGRSVLRFDGSNDNLVSTFGATLSQPVTIFAVAALDASAVGDTQRHFMFDGIDGTNRCAMLQNRAALHTYSIFAGTLLDGGDMTANWTLWTMLASGGSSQLWLNGVSSVIGAAGANVATGATVGARYDVTQLWKGDIAELIFCSAVTSRAGMEAALMAKWGIT